MPAEDRIRAVHKPTGVIEIVPRGYVEEAFPHLYREATEKDLAAARKAAEEALAAADAPKAESSAKTADDKEGK